MKIFHLRLLSDLRHNISVALRESHGDIADRVRTQMAEWMREKAREAATHAADCGAYEEDPTDAAELLRKHAQVYRAIADVLDPRDDEDTVAACIWSLGNAHLDRGLFREVFGVDHSGKEGLHEQEGFGLGLRPLWRAGLLTRSEQDLHHYHYSPLGLRVLAYGLEARRREASSEP